MVLLGLGKDIREKSNYGIGVILNTAVFQAEIRISGATGAGGSL